MSQLSVCVVRRGFFPDDPRLRKQVHALLERDVAVDVVCLRRAGQPRLESWRGARVHRLRVGHRRAGRARYLWQYGAFFVLALARVSRLHMGRRFRVVQVNTMPDALVFTALLPKLSGAKVVLDMQELMPEMFGALFGARRGRAVFFAGLRFLERISARFADRVLVANPCHVSLLEARTGLKPLLLVPNVPDEDTLPRPAAAKAEVTDDVPVVMTHGSMLERYGVQVLIEALARLGRARPLRGVVIGEGEYLPMLKALAARLGHADRIAFLGWLPPHALQEQIADATIGVVPLLRDGYIETVMPNKLFDYAALDVPVIASDTPGIRARCPDDAVAFVTPGDPDALAAAIAAILDDPQRRQRMVQRMRAVYEPIRWSRSKRSYVEAVMSLVDARPAPPGAAPDTGD